MRLVVIATLSYQLAQTVDSAHFQFGGPARPFDFRSGTLQVAEAALPAAQAGIREGDTILALNGRPLRQRTQVDEYLRTVPSGASLRVTYSHPGQSPQEAAITLAPAVGAARSRSEQLMSLFMEFVTRWFCLALGLFVVIMRPTDPLAWLVLAMMLSFCNLESSAGNLADGWPQPFRALGVWYSTFLQRSWPLWMLLFGLYFPDPSRKPRKVAWTRWALGLPIFLFALVNSLLRAWEHSSRPVPPGLQALVENAGSVVNLLGFVAIGIFFMCLQLKRYSEPDPDARRRLKLLFWGANVSLSPIFALIVYTSIAHVSVGSINPVVLAAVVLMLFLFPATLAYVLVVEKAMDVRVVLRQGLQYALAQRAMRILLGFLIMGIVYFTFETLNDPKTHRPMRLQAIALCATAIILLQRGSGKAAQWIDRRFFREQVETEQVLVKLGEEVRSITDPIELKQRVCRRISESLHVPRVEITANGPGPTHEIAFPLTAGATQLGHLVLGPKLSEEPYSGSDRRLLQTVASQTALALENARLTSAVASEAAQRERIHRELEIAREVQERLFPHHPPVVAGLDYAGRCRPAQSIGGDYYDFFLTSEGRLIVALGDICGKGVPAALLMASLQASLRGLCAGGVNDLGEIMGHLNRLVFDATPRNRFATLWCAVYDPQTRILRHSSAGHGDALVLRSSGATEKAGVRGLALGLTRTARYSCGDLQLQSGDLVAVCTDGVTEAHNPDREEFGDERWQASLQAAAALAPASILDRIIQQVDTFAAGAEQHDDITVMALRVQS
ncbi:SpoIIE family protein phosphatase [Paludibaculum fermentans]|uniref:SpoIIE family protein phosphatase n=1 Tax=Paludibaculum fermentans TaxID=1473598 RepID=A0A7S7NPL7_PALFE|nr:SpoIIE family protein phosphatase [Paludibaculum fermentans]QOY87451.1 SpoIIE family protein phosphatase [Paludibaculum fermentans]